ncbi:hypothetical protein BJ742DRAFT_779673 [Cladochytrium replicatum]|nr:hypothetical protein BJ742DRAFT_779673 [Cladochytrium replicatum]
MLDAVVGAIAQIKPDESPESQAWKTVLPRLKCSLTSGLGNFAFAFLESETISTVEEITHSLLTFLVSILMYGRDHGVVHTNYRNASLGIAKLLATFASSFENWITERGHFILPSNSTKMKAFNKLFNPKDKTAKTAKKESAIVTVQSLSPLNNDTVLVQLELPPDVSFSDFAAAALSKLDLAGHRFNGHSPQFLINTAVHFG